MKNLVIKFLLINLLSISAIVSIIAQTETTQWKYQFDLNAGNSNQMDIPNQRSSMYLKLINTNRVGQYDFPLGTAIKKAITDESLGIYEPGNIDKPYPKNEITLQLDARRIDTVITYHEETYEEIQEIFESKESKYPTIHTVYQLQQNWNFNKKKQKLNNPIILIHILDESKKNENGKTLFTIKNKWSSKKINTRKLLNKKNVTWAKSIYYYGKFKNKKLREAILSKSHLRKHKIVNTIDYKKMNQAEVVELLAGSVDTLLDYKVDDIEPQISIVKKEALTAENILDFKILQDFYFCTKTNSILTKVVAIAPAIKKYDEGGNYLYTLPLFWIVYDKNFNALSVP